MSPRKTRRTSSRSSSSVIRNRLHSLHLRPLLMNMVAVLSPSLGVVCTISVLVGMSGSPEVLSKVS